MIQTLVIIITSSAPEAHAASTAAHCHTKIIHTQSIPKNVWKCEWSAFDGQAREVSRVEYDLVFCSLAMSSNADSCHKLNNLPAWHHT